ncbi:DUF6153 family protein [Pseudolysinimonas yzui]|uniref:DUF6153 family protein n=1 Tax=Pseudolysinimonas yzui TaxID=2708254 RepID=UPI00357173D5
MVTLSAIRSVAHPPTAAVRTLLLSLLGVAAVVVGLLAMHTFSLDEPTHTPAAAVSPMEHQAGETARSPEPPATSSDCGTSGCEPMHAMGFMACLLALLVVSLVFGAAPHISRWLANLRTDGRVLLSALLAAVPAPPSLISLSISRT